MAEVRFENISKRFNNVEVIKGINIVIKDREFFTFVGPSGCGKSTILNMIAGLESVSEGYIYFDGKIVNDTSPKERDVAMVFQSYALYPHLNVFENIAFPLRIKKLSAEYIEREVNKVSEMLGIESLLKRLPKELSGGEKQRVALGRAIIRKPKVFLLDEPLSNLDAKLRMEMRAELKKLHNELKVTMIYVTHDQAEAMTLSDRIGVLFKGEILQVGSPMEVYEFPENVFVGEFVGSPSMNFIEGTIKREDGYFFYSDGLRVNIQENILKKILNKISNERLIVGIRPEYIKISKQKTLKGIESYIYAVEPMGSESFVTVKLYDKKLTCKAEPEFKAEFGEKVFIEFNELKFHFFERDKGGRIKI
ncbi:MAG: ABC transporter ATP-binding protein [Acidobacteriota bacterium]